MLPGTATEWDRVGHAAASGTDMTGGYIGHAIGCYKSVGDLIGVLLCQW